MIFVKDFFSLFFGKVYRELAPSPLDGVSDGSDFATGEEFRVLSYFAERFFELGCDDELCRFNRIYLLGYDAFGGCHDV